MAVVTISREYGAGGLVVGRRLAELLEADFMDSALMAEVARRLRLAEETVHRLDERREGIVLRLLRAMRSSYPEYTPLPPTEEEIRAAEPDPEAIADVVAEVIREAARSGRAVIVGRGAARVLADWPGVLHLRLVAARETRVRRVAARDGVDEITAARLVDAADRDRSAYLKHHFGDDGRDPVLYHAVINTERVGLDAAALIIARMVTLAEGGSES
jgi:cytidylate kinase